MATRTDVWFEYFHQACKIANLTQEDCERYATGALKMKEVKEKLRVEKEKKFIQVIIKGPPRDIDSKGKRPACKATLMNGKPCSNRAMCGEFCKRHRLVNNNNSL